MGPHVIVLPGGSYRRHAPHEAEPVVAWLRGLGLPASVLRYPVDAVHPAQLDAIRAEVRRLRAEGATRVALLGFSAGGHAAGLAALAPGADETTRVDAAILGYPVVSMSDPIAHELSTENLLGPGASDELKRAVSLELLVTPEARPFFVWHTADDRVVPVQHSLLLARALADAGVRHELHVFPNGRHGLGLAEGSGLPEQWTRLAAAWLRSEGWLPRRGRWRRTTGRP